MLHKKIKTSINQSRLFDSHCKKNQSKTKQKPWKRDPKKQIRIYIIQILPLLNVFKNMSYRIFFFLKSWVITC